MHNALLKAIMIIVSKKISCWNQNQTCESTKCNMFEFQPYEATSMQKFKYRAREPMRTVRCICFSADIFLLIINIFIHV